MNPDFILSEAQQMLAFSYVADILGPHKTGPIAPSPDFANPLGLNDDGKHYPYPVMPIWPSGWTPAFKSPDKLFPWKNSVLKADPVVKPNELIKYFFGANNVVAAYNSDLNAFVIAFAGTENLDGMTQDLMFTPAPAGPFTGKYYSSSACYYTDANYYNPSLPEGQPNVIKPMMHLGFRLAVEEYTVNAKDSCNLVTAFKNVVAEKNLTQLNLFVTGHSLGGAMAGVFSAFVNAGGLGLSIPVNLKTYTFAAPKFANDALANNIDNTLTKAGFYYRVVNNLDSVPQIPPTIEWLNDLNNPAMINAFLPKDNPVVKALSAVYDLIAIGFKFMFPNENPDFNYVHSGTPQVVQGTFPIVYTGSNLPPQVFPGGTPSFPTPATTLTQQWWQHWPYVYYWALMQNNPLGQEAAQVSN